MLLTLIPVSLALLVLGRVWYLRRRHTARRTRDHRSVARARVSTTAPTRASLPPDRPTTDDGRAARGFPYVVTVAASTSFDAIVVQAAREHGLTSVMTASSPSAASTGDV